MSTGTDRTVQAHARGRRALALFDELADLAPADRAPVLDRLKTEDEALFAEVVALLSADESDGPLERPLSDWLTAPEPMPERLGPWRITGVAGRGGMGAVYFGERDDGQFSQRAALKRIRLGMDSPGLRLRFLRERQILAALNHPHIATLLDGGVGDDGAPYFAMERVEGQPLGRWCDERETTLAGRVGLMLQVCSAVQYAHQNLVVHRDLKPANVLVDAQGQVKLLDFGIAKLLDASASGGTTRERPHTPDYAAPEQVAGGPITTATDVYGLGATLHELLVGSPPRRAGEALWQAAQRATDDDARRRGFSSKVALERAVRGDLSAIVQRCLEAEPNARYPSAGAVAQDLEAFLQGRAVSARSPTRGYLAWKFVARHRLGVAVAAAVVLAVGGSAASALWQASLARRAAAEAQAQLDYLGSLLQVLSPSTAEARELDRSRLVTEATRRARAELADRPESLASVEFALAKVAQNVGDLPQALALADSAYERRVALVGRDAVASAEVQVLSAVLRARVSPPRFAEAEQLMEAALAVLRRRAPGSVTELEAVVQRAWLAGEQEKVAVEEATLAEALARCEGPLADTPICEEAWLVQGAVASRSHLPEVALKALLRAADAKSRRLGPDHASTLNVKSMVAWAQAEAGDLAGGLAVADEVYQAYQRIFTQPTETSLRAGLRLSRLAKRSGQHERALMLVDEYLVHARRVFGEHNQNTVLGLSDRASLLFGMGRFDEAASEFERVAAEYAAIDNRLNAALTRSYAADSLREAGQAARALPIGTEALATLRQSYPKGQHVNLARVLTNVARTESLVGHHPEALAHHAEAVAMHRALQPTSSYTAHARAFEGEALFAAGQRAEGERVLRAAVAELSASKTASPNMYWEPFAVLTTVACANGAADCDTLKAEAKAQLEAKLAAGTLSRLRAAVR
ncbi:MAG: serine/threonine-protein kinase [Myxococcaceae bacterium]|jgi:serine/threonine-protein kinase|nr:serine/threonine-protein kinase [Myxococcaceae bacterium]